MRPPHAPPRAIAVRLRCDRDRHPNADYSAAAAAMGATFVTDAQKLLTAKLDVIVISVSILSFEKVHCPSWPPSRPPRDRRATAARPPSRGRCYHHACR